MTTIAQPESAIATAITEIEQHFPGRLDRNTYTCEQHGKGESWHAPIPPDGVFFANSTEEVSQLLGICSKHKCPVIPFGAGSSEEGQIQALQGGISIDLSEMNQLLCINAIDMDCSVQCGMIRQDLNQQTSDLGLFFPIDIGAHATIGGMASTRASGTMTVRYGTMKDLVLGMTVVLPDGRIIKTGGRARKSSAGYDLTRLFIGAEGTLGIITELTLRLFGVTESAAAAMCSFDSINTATELVVEAMQYGLSFSRIELADSLQMRGINQYCKTNYAENPTLFFDLTGSTVSVEHDLAVLEKLVQSFQPIAFTRAQSQHDYDALWEIRHSALYAAGALKPGSKGISTDVCVPISELPRCIADIQALIAETDIVAPLIGHVGDGNFHLLLLYAPDHPTEFDEVQRLHRALTVQAHALGGTCTGEHGVGIGNKQYMLDEHGEALELMRTIKNAIDPSNIMNPGKIFD